MENWEKQVVILTGGLGSGKSTAAAEFKRLGAFIVSADELAHQAVKPGSPALASISQQFGPSFLTPDGELDRRKLGQLVFKEPTQKAKLEAIIHPVVRKLAQAAFKTAPEKSLKIYDVPLYFEANLDRFPFAAVVVVDAPLEVRLKRILQRDQLTLEEIQDRINSQTPLAEKVKRADYVLDNSGTLESLQQQVGKLYQELNSR